MSNLALRLLTAAVALPLVALLVLWEERLGFALLVFLHLGAQLTVYAAEVNVVVTRKLWPRSLLGPPQAPADERALTALAKVEERHDVERVDVEFDTTRSQNS